MQQKILNRTFKIPSHQEQMILSSSMNEKTYLQVSLKEFMKLLTRRDREVVDFTRSRVKKNYSELANLGN